MNRRFSWLDLITPIFCSVLVVSNVVAQKYFNFDMLGVQWSLDVGTLIGFPLLYIVGDILVEVWGYATARKVIWTGFATQLIAAAMFMLAVAMPSSPYFDAAPAFSRILGAVPILVVASLVGYWAGSFTNSFIMAKLKEKMVKWDPSHKFLAVRTISSTIVGELVDTSVFVGIGAIFGIFPSEIFMMLIITQWIVKTLIEALMTPVTMVVVKKLKEYEQVDALGSETYSPFKISKK